jgi:hypothetical protein
VAQAGRATKQSDARVGRILESLRRGTTRKAAALSSGISEDTFLRWLKAGTDFAEKVAIAEAEAEAHYTGVIYQAALEDAKWAVWWLENRRPDVYSPKELDIKLEAARLARLYDLDARDVLRRAEAMVLASGNGNSVA